MMSNPNRMGTTRGTSEWNCCFHQTWGQVVATSVLLQVDTAVVLSPAHQGLGVCQGSGAGDGATEIWVLFCAPPEGS